MIDIRHGENQIGFNRRSVLTFDGYMRRRVLQDRVAAHQDDAHDVDDDSWRSRRKEPDFYRKPVAFVRPADIRQAELGEESVRQHDYVVRRGQKMSGAPIRLDDTTFGAIAKDDPVAWHIGAAKIERYA